MKLFIPTNVQDIKTLCIYHRVDMDGKCSGAIINYLYKKISKPNMSNKIWFIGCNYEKDFSIDEILAAFPNVRSVYIVDYSIEPDEALKLIDNNIDVVWCDHHKTAIEKYENHPEFCEDMSLKDDEHIKSFKVKNRDDSLFWGVTSYKYSGAKLVYLSLLPTLMQVVHDNQILATMSTVVDLVSIYDTWDHSDLERWDTAYLFNNATKLYDLHPTKDMWDVIFEDPETIKKMLSEGSIVIKIHDIQNKITADAYSGTLMWEGLRFCTINKLGNSNIVNSTFNPDIHDAVLLYMYSPKENMYKISMYSHDKLPDYRKEELDLSTIATKYGGGGHKLACGFACEDLPFDIHSIKPISK